MCVNSNVDTKRLKCHKCNNEFDTAFFEVDYSKKEKRKKDCLFLDDLFVIHVLIIYFVEL